MVMTKGGIRVGNSFWRSANYTYPFAHLRLTPELLEIKYPLGQIRLNKTSIRRLVLRRGMFSRGIQIIHTANDVEPFVLFWTFKPRAVIEMFSQMKFPVELLRT